MIKILVVQLFLLCSLVGCTNEKPVPKSKISSNSPVVLATNTTNLSKNEHSLHVEHHVRGNDVYIECIVPNFIFKKSGGPKKEGEGHINVVIDGKRVDKISTAAFIIKGLSKGEHTLKIQLVHNDLTNYSIFKIVKVDIN